MTIIGFDFFVEDIIIDGIVRHVNFGNPSKVHWECWPFPPTRFEHIFSHTPYVSAHRFQEYRFNHEGHELHNHLASTRVLGTRQKTARL